MSKQVHVGIRLDEETKEELVRLAAAQHRTISGYLVHLIKEKVAEEATPPRSKRPRTD